MKFSIRSLILDQGSLTVLALVVLIFGALQFGVKWSVDNFRSVDENVSCTVKEVGNFTNQVGLVLSCKGKEISVTSTSVVVAYIKNPQPVICTIYRAGNPICHIEERAGK